jgi:hypothetical protein
VGNAVAVDAAGNVYTAGSFLGTADFDPSPAGTFNLTSAGNTDAFVSKLDNAGNFVWARDLGGVQFDQANGIAVDAHGNVYTTGSFEGTADFDPSAAGTFNLTSAGSDDAFVSKLDAGGNFVWARALGGTGFDAGTAIAVDAQGNVYTTGSFRGTADFDPSAGVFDLTSAGGADAYVSKLDGAGNFAWARALGGPGTDQGNGIAVDAAGSVYTTGSFSGTADFDPSAATYNLTSAGSFDVFISKLDSGGRFALARAVGGPGTDQGFAIAVDAGGNIDTAGSFQGTVDFDPSAGVFNLTSAGGDDAFVSKQRQTVVKGTVWQDTNGDGLHGAAEPARPGVVVELVGSADGIIGNADDVLLATTLTDATGAYQFSVTQNFSRYYVRFRPGVGVGFTRPGADSAADATGKTALFALTDGATVSKSAGLTGAPPLFGFGVGAGGHGSDTGRAVTTDAAGYVYVTGSFQGTAVFGSGATAVQLRSTGSDDVFVAKYTPTGALVWARSMGGAGSDQGLGIAVDAQGNVYTTGSFTGTADFDPSGGVFGLTSAGGADIFVSKLDAAGNFVWADALGGTGTDQASAIAVDAAGNVYLTGSFEGTADFDPSAGTFNLTSAGGSDVFVTRLDGAGNLVWADALGGPAADQANGIAVDAAGNVYTTGSFQGTADFDPSAAGTFNLTSAGDSDAFVSKLDASGNFVWADALGGAGTDQGNAIALDAQGNVYTTGSFQGTADFDPSAGTFNLTSAGGADAFVSKLNGAGNFIWARSMGGPGTDQGLGIAVDPQGNVYTTGSFEGTANFNPSAAAFNLTSAGGSDAFVSKLDGTGRFAWARALGGPNADQASAVAVDAQGNAYTTGSFTGTADFDPSPAAFNLTSAGGSDIFVSKLQQSVLTGTAWNDLNGNGIHEATEPALAGVAVDLVRSTNTVVGDGDDVVLATAVTDAQGHYRFVVPTDSGNYFLRFRPPVGFGFTTGSGSAIASTATGATALFLLPPGGTANRDAGLRGTAPAFGNNVAVGGTGSDVGRAVATDAAGNVYVTGSFQGTADFDPGPGVVSVTSAGDDDVFVAKYTPGGALVWARQIGGAGSDVGLGIAVSPSGDVFLTGYFQGTVDFNPGTDTAFLTASGFTDAFVCRLDTDGRLVWARDLGGDGDTSGAGIALDAQGNVYTAGTFTGTVDLDPGSGVTALTASGNSDAFVSELDPAGNFVFGVQLDGSGDVGGQAITVSPGGVVLATGSFTGTADFDPGSGTFNLTSGGGRDVFVSALAPSSGTFVNAWQMGGTEDDVGLGIATDAAGDIYTTGYFGGTVDFDPGAGTTLLSSHGQSDAFVSKLDPAGNFLWARPLGGAGPDTANAVAVDAAGNVYVTGAFSGAANLDPGAAFLLTARGGTDVFVDSLDASGNLRLARQAGGVNDDEAFGIGVAPNGDLVTTGSFDGTGGFDPTSPAATGLTSQGSLDVFLSRWKQPVTNTRPVITGARANQPVLATATIAPMATLGLTDPDNQALTITLVIANGVNRGDFLATTTAGWVQSVSGNDIVYTRTFTGANVGSLAQAALRLLVFKPRAGAASGEKTVFTLSADDGTGAVGNAGEISVIVP